jgi:uncharacterized protein (DUF58 family)
VTGRGRLVVALGLFVYLAAWAFGSKPLYPVATGLLLVSAASWGWMHLANRPFGVRRGSGDSEHVEGDDVPVVVELESTGRVLPPAATLLERVGRLGEQRHALNRHGRRLNVRYVLRSLPRGRYVFADPRVELTDAFGLQRAVVELPTPGALLVYPRLVELRRLFSDAGALAHAGKRLLLRRPTGFDLHSVREYEHGDSLRHVHWRSTAHRGQLMVKELEDAPRDEIAVLLDVEASAVVGESFEVQVRAAGSILDAYVRRGRRAVLVANSAEQQSAQKVHSPAADWRRALEVLAAVEPGAGVSAARLLADASGPATRALELVVVTARVEPQLVDRLLQRAAARRKVALVYVDPTSFAGAEPQPEPALLRLQAAGVSIAVVRRGDDLAERLEGQLVQGAAARA